MIGVCGKLTVFALRRPGEERREKARGKEKRAADILFASSGGEILIQQFKIFAWLNKSKCSDNSRNEAYQVPQTTAH